MKLLTRRRSMAERRDPDERVPSRAYRDRLWGALRDSPELRREIDEFREFTASKEREGSPRET